MRKMLQVTSYKSRRRKGFTLLEMLVVLAIISMLLAVALASYSGIKQKNRDVIREQNIKEIEVALFLYASSYHIFPLCGDLGGENYVVINGTSDCLSSVLIEDGLFMPVVPTDPLGGSAGTCGTLDNYIYCYASDGYSYTIKYALETDSIFGKTTGWQTINVTR